MSKKTYDDDDGRVIANMNVPGMPWYQGGASKPKRINYAENDEPIVEKAPGADLTRGETASIIWAATKAALLIALVFSVVLVIVALGFGYWPKIVGWFGG